MCQSLLARACAVLLFAFAAYADGLPQSRFTTVDLSDYFTMDAVSTASAPAEGEIDGEYAFPASRLPTPGTVELLDAVFRFPPTDGDRLNAFVPKGQTVEVPRGRYESVLFLGASVHGSAETKVELTIELDGRVGEIEETLRFTNWCTPKRFGELVAAECPYRLGAGGEAPPANYLWLQPIYLPEGAVLRAIKFHDQWKFRIFAITLDRERYELPTPERFEYLLYRVERLAPSGEAFAEAFRTLDGLSTALEIPWVAEDLSRMRDLFVDRYDYDDLFTEVVEPLEQKLAPFIERVAELDDRTRQWLERQPDDPDFNATLVGHSHLDAAWLWSKHESVEKAFRTFSKNVERLDRYEDFVYLQSSPRFYEWMERHRPEVFEDIRRLVEAGKWEPVGGMWIESDAVLPTGEALARQRLLGQRYYLAKFGALSKVAWFPDTFGAGANLPQIFLKSGSPYYFTAKLGWNYENEFPVYHFRWRAPDGSEVIGLNSPIELGWSPGPYEWLKDSMRTRNVLAKPGKEIVLSSAAPAIPEAARAEETIPEMLQIFGEGDGGEGPTDKMIQRGAYLAMTPDYQFGRASDYFAEIERRYGDRLPVWEDEIYLENHRGVSSSERRVKKLNRLAEPALIAAERWGAIASEVAGYEFPKEEWRRAWKILLFNDFHDILPGTSIPQVFVDAERDYDELLRIAERIRDDALSAIAANVSTLPPEEERDGAAFGEGAPLILFNPLPWDRDEYVRVEWGFPWTRVIDDNGEEIPSQTVFRDGENILIYKARVPALGYATYRLLGKSEPDEDWTPMIDGSTVSNDYYRLTLDPETGDVASWYDERVGAPLLRDPAAGVRYFHNYPKEFSNWNVDPDYDSKEIVPLPDERRRVTILDDGPVFAAIEVVSPAPNGGELRREYLFYRESPRVEVSMDLDVFYRESIVKAELPFAVGADEVVAETPFYAQPHPVNPRTSFEKAKIELRAQKWLDMSGEDYGVTALLTATSGFDVKDGRLRLTLVKGGANPNPNTDVGSHRIEYALEPHPGDWKTADAWKRGYEYHYPIVPRLEPQHEGTFPARKSFGGTAVGTASDHVCWEALKPSEDGDDLVVRVYEAEGRAAERVELRLPFVVAKAVETDLLEIETIGDVAADGDSIVFEIEPYEILTIKITPAR